MSLFIRLLPAILSFLLLAAHFLREANIILLVVSALLPFLLFWRTDTVVKFLQFCLLLTAFEWLLAGYQILEFRLAMGESWVRMVIILLLVALFSLYSAWLLNSKRVK